MTPQLSNSRITSALLAFIVYTLMPWTAASQPSQTSVQSGRPRVSPDGRHIAFTSNRDGTPDVYVIVEGGTGLRRLTHGPEREEAVAWTRDGRRVVFSRFAADTSRIFTMDSEGNDVREIGMVSGRAPVLFPDGRRTLSLVGSFTSNRLTVSDLTGGDARFLSDGSAVIFNPSLSPDGERIAYTRMGSARKLQVWVMNVDGAGARAATRFSDEEGRAQGPSWSPDGRRLAIQANVNRPDAPASAHIWIIDVESGVAARIGAHDRPYLDETPFWFPDGKRIAFQSNRSGTMEVWVMNSEGSGARQVTNAR